MKLYEGVSGWFCDGMFDIGTRTAFGIEQRRQSFRFRCVDVELFQLGKGSIEGQELCDRGAFGLYVRNALFQPFVDGSKGRRHDPVGGLCGHMSGFW